MKRISLLTLTLCAFLALGCEKKTQGGIPEWPWETPDKPTPEEPKPVKKEKTDDVPHENMGKVADELRIDDDLELDDSEDYWDDDYDEPDSVYEDEEEYGRDYADEAEEEYYSEYEDEDDIYDNEMPDFEEEFRVNPEHSTEPDDREVPDDDDEEMDILSATTPLSRKEKAKLIAT